MNSTPYTVPPRSHKIDELVCSIALCGKKIEEIKNDPAETNATLAMCEIAMSLPTAWYADPEKLMIVSIVSILYGDAKKFLADLNEGTISFYERMREECKSDFDHEIPELSHILAECHLMHDSVTNNW